MAPLSQDELSRRLRVDKEFRERIIRSCESFDTVPLLRPTIAAPLLHVTPDSHTCLSSGHAVMSSPS